MLTIIIILAILSKLVKKKKSKDDDVNLHEKKISMPIFFLNHGGEIEINVNGEKKYFEKDSLDGVLYFDEGDSVYLRGLVCSKNETCSSFGLYTDDPDHDGGVFFKVCGAENQKHFHILINPSANYNYSLVVDYTINSF